jgi:hypothetical protein
MFLEIATPFYPRRRLPRVDARHSCELQIRGVGIGDHAYDLVVQPGTSSSCLSDVTTAYAPYMVHAAHIPILYPP